MDRIGLIERAAALLREGANGTGSSSVEVPILPPVGLNSGSAGVVGRTCTLDRAALAGQGIIMPWAATERVVEEFRIVKRNVMAHWQDSGRVNGSSRSVRSVMVTSSKPREGKTFTAINLALAFAAEENLTVVLMDADPVRGDTARRLKIPAEPGLATVLAGEIGFADALIQTDLPNLLVLPPGEYGPHVPELLSGRASSVLFNDLARRYPDCVIVIDTAPSLASAVPANLAPNVSQIVFVVEAGQTQQSEIEAAVHLLSGCSHISFLLNKAPSSNEHFGGYSYYNGSEYVPGKVATD